MAKSRRIMLSVLCVVLVLLLAVGSFAVRAYDRLACAEHLKRIVSAMYMEFPSELATHHEDSTLPTLFHDPAIQSYEIRCPSSNGSYVFYLLRANAEDDRGTLLVAFEPLDNHAGKGANVLFEDGHVRFVEPEEYHRILDTWKDRLVEEWKSDG